MDSQKENILDKYFDTIKEENYKKSFNDVEYWLRRETEKPLMGNAKPKMTLFKFIFSEGRVKFAYLFVILLLVGITSNFSVTRTEPVGIVMSWAINKQNPEAIKKIDNFDWIDKSKLVVNEEESDGKQVLTYKMLIPSANPEEIEKFKTELGNIKDIYAVNVIPISEPVKQPLYAVALEKVFNVDYAKNYVNPDEIKNNVYEQLKYAGIQNDVNFDVLPVSSAGKYVSFDFGKKPDSIRIKVHTDVVNDYVLGKALDDVELLLAPVKIISDSILKTVVVDVNGESVVPEVIMLQVQKNLDSLQWRLKGNEKQRKERMEEFHKRMEKFNERMEKFNKNMEKMYKKMEKYDEKMKNLKIPKYDYNYEIDEDGDIDIDIDIDVEDLPDDIEIPDVPEVIDLSIDEDELNNIKISVDSLNVHLDLEKIKTDVKENMKSYKEEMKKLKEELKKNKYYIYDSSKVKKYYKEYNENNEEDENEEEIENDEDD